MRKKTACTVAAGEVAADGARMPRTVLIALCGQSPAVVTETVWCLAREKPSAIPDVVEVITTAEGNACIQRDLLDSGAWERLRKTLRVPPRGLRFGATSSIHITACADGTRDASDIAAGDDSAEFADLALRILRGYTEDSSTRVVFSIAGGRKSMSAIGALCMALLGREGDRLCHVLVNDPFDKRLDPPFVFPVPGKKYRHNDKAVIQKPNLTLYDIPFPRCRNLFAEQLQRLPECFAEFVAAANRSADAATAARIELEPGAPRPECRVNGKPVHLGFSEFVLFWFLCRRCVLGEPPVGGYKELHAAMLQFWQAVPDVAVREKQNRVTEYRRIEKDPNAVIKIVASLKQKLVEADAPLSCLPAREKGRYGVAVPPSHIAIIGE